MSARAQEIRAGLAWLHAADPVLAQVIDERPDFDPDVWTQHPTDHVAKNMPTRPAQR
jgi:hypothetical protein